MIYMMQQLLNSGSKNMNVNGGTPKTFSYTVSADSQLVKLICLLKDEGATDFTKFGAITALSNGVLIQVTQGGNTRTVATLKDNGDLCTMFPTNQFGNGAVLSILSVVTPEGFGDTNNCFMGEVTFDDPIILANGDSISVIIQDNLSTIDVFQMSCGLHQD